MDVSQAQSRLKDLLGKAGFDNGNPDPKLAWQVYKQFARERVSCADDDLLFQAGSYRFTGEDLFYFDFVRQFTIEDQDGNYDHMEQLHIEFTRQPDQLLKKIKIDLWADDIDHSGSFFSTVESMSEFQLAISYPDWKCNIYQEQV